MISMFVVSHILLFTVLYHCIAVSYNIMLENGAFPLVGIGFFIGAFGMADLPATTLRCVSVVPLAGDFYRSGSSAPMGIKSASCSNAFPCRSITSNTARSSRGASRLTRSRTATDRSNRSTLP